MPSISLSAYKFSVYSSRPENGVTEIFPINNIEGMTILDVVSEFCSYYHLYSRDIVKQSVFKSTELQRFEESDNGDQYLNFKSLTGSIEVGEWGYTRDIVNPDNGEVVDTIDKNLADVKPFIFSVFAPFDEEDDAAAGIIVFQNLGVYGIKTVFIQKFKEHFRSIHRNYNIEFSALCPTAYAAHLIDCSEFKEVRIIKNQIPADEADQIGLNSRNGYVEWCYKGIDGLNERKKQELKDFICGTARDLRGVLQMPALDYDNIKFTLKRGNKLTTLNLNNLNNLNISEAVPDNVIGENGHPTVDLIKLHLIQMYRDYIPHIRE